MFAIAAFANIRAAKTIMIIATINLLIFIEHNFGDVDIKFSTV